MGSVGLVSIARISQAVEPEALKTSSSQNSPMIQELGLRTPEARKSALVKYIDVLTGADIEHDGIEDLDRAQTFVYLNWILGDSPASEITEYRKMVAHSFLAFLRQHDDAKVRDMVARYMRGNNPAEAASYKSSLVRHLGECMEPNDALREEALTVLAKMAKSDKDDIVRTAAREAMTRLGAEESPTPTAQARESMETTRASALPLSDLLKMAAAKSPDDEREKAYLMFDESSISDDNDVKALYEGIAAIPSMRDDKHSERRMRIIRHLAAQLTKCQRPEQHAILKELLEREDRDIPKGYLGPWGVKSEEELSRESVRYERLSAIMNAVGHGKNELALPTLRKMRGKGGQAQKMAETAIGRIGKDDDLDAFIREIKSDPNSNIDLIEFGRKSFDRILREIDDSSVPAAEKRRIAARLPSAVRKEDLPTITKLLKNENPDIVDIVTGIVGRSVTADDDVIIRDMLKSPQRMIRGPALLAIDRLWDKKYLPDVLTTLKKGATPWERSCAARILGSHKVVESEQALQDAARNDPTESVRESASFAYQSLTK